MTLEILAQGERRGPGGVLAARRVLPLVLRVAEHGAQRIRAHLDRIDARGEKTDLAVAALAARDEAEDQRERGDGVCGEAGSGAQRRREGTGHRVSIPDLGGTGRPALRAGAGCGSTHCWMIHRVSRWPKCTM